MAVSLRGLISMEDILLARDTNISFAAEIKTCNVHPIELRSSKNPAQAESDD